MSEIMVASSDGDVGTIHSSGTSHKRVPSHPGDWRTVNFNVAVRVVTNGDQQISLGESFWYVEGV